LLRSSFFVRTLNSSNVSAIAEDRKGQIWAAIEDRKIGGLPDHVIRSLNCKSCPEIHLPPALLGRFWVTRMIFDKDNQLWLIADDGYIYEYDKVGKWLQYSIVHNPDINLDEMLQVLWVDMTIDGLGRVWVSSLTKGMYFIDPSTSEVKSSGLRGVGCLVTDYEGKPWLLDRDGNIRVLDSDEWKVVAVAGDISDFIVTEKNDVWVKTGEGVSLLGMDNSRKNYSYLKMLEPYIGNNKKLIGGDGNIFLDKWDRVWVGNYWGLWMLDQEVGWTHYNVTVSGLLKSDSEFQPNQVTCRVLDSKGKLWVEVEKRTNTTEFAGDVIIAIDLNKIP
jgi:ligand-binding sensor domain-containing protein